jgi:hypothetical protein
VKVIKTVIIVTLVLLSLIPLSSASKEYSFRTDKVLVVLPGESFNDTLTVVNTLPVNFTLVVYLGYYVEPSGHLNFTPIYSVFKDWKAGESQRLAFNLTVGSDVPEGEYEIVVRFRGIDEEGSIYTVLLPIYVEVRKNPLTFSRFEWNVLERPGFRNPFRGETLIIDPEVWNIGRYPIGARVNLTIFDPLGRAVHNSSLSRIVSPGQEKFEFRVPIGWNWSLGSYRGRITLASPYGVEVKTFEFTVDNGLEILNASTSVETVLKGEEVEAYLTIISERKIRINVTFTVFKNSRPIATGVVPVNLSPGTEIVRISLPTDISGTLHVRLSLTYRGVGIDNVTLSYTVLEYPLIENVKTVVNSTHLYLRLFMLNPNAGRMNCSLYYELNSSGALLYSDIVGLTLNPGENVRTFDFPVLPNSTVTYLVKLEGEGKEFDKASGSIFIPPLPVNSQSLNTSSITNSTGAVGGSKPPLLWIVGALILIVVGIILFFVFGSKGEESYVSPWERARKPRTRPKPKRRSPLGRFKRPKFPKFIENHELPRRFRRRPISKTRKKRK